jgi:hypothetical protein
MEWNGVEWTGGEIGWVRWLANLHLLKYLEIIIYSLTSLYSRFFIEEQGYDHEQEKQEIQIVYISHDSM